MAHKPEWQLIEEIGRYASAIQIGARYSHYKDPRKTYTVKDLVVIESDESIGVLYQADYRAGLTFVRPASEWLEEVEFNGIMMSRFQRA